LNKRINGFERRTKPSVKKTNGIKLSFRARRTAYATEQGTINRSGVFVLHLLKHALDEIAVSHTIAPRFVVVS
jgi:hypothetical protein